MVLNIWQLLGTEQNLYCTHLGQGGSLFFEYFRIWSELPHLFKERNLFWLFENTSSMEVARRAQISRYFHVSFNRMVSLQPSSGFCNFICTVVIPSWLYSSFYFKAWTCHLGCRMLYCDEAGSIFLGKSAHDLLVRLIIYFVPLEDIFHYISALYRFLNLYLVYTQEIYNV